MGRLFDNPSICKMVDSQKLPSAIVSEGADSLSLAKEIAAAVVCTGEIRPCGVCAHCLKSKKDIHPDIMVYEGSGAARSFSIDTIRAIRQDAYILPNEADRKVYILSGAETLSEQAQNALLKILEEPPAYVLFILACLNKTALLPTVLSRSVVFSAGGERRSDSDMKEMAAKIAAAVTGSNELTLLKQIAVVGTDKGKFRAVAEELMDIFRQVYLIKSGIASENATAAALSGEITMVEAVAAIEALRESLSGLERNANMNLTATRLSASLRTAAGR